MAPKTCNQFVDIWRWFMSAFLSFTKTALGLVAIAAAIVGWSDPPIGSQALRHRSQTDRSVRRQDVRSFMIFLTCLYSWSHAWHDWRSGHPSRDVILTWARRRIRHAARRPPDYSRLPMSVQAARSCGLVLKPRVLLLFGPRIVALAKNASSATTNRPAGCNGLKHGKSIVRGSRWLMRTAPGRPRQSMATESMSWALKDVCSV